LVDLEVFYLGHLKNFYTIQYNTIQYTSAPVLKCLLTLLDTSALVPKCLGTEVSWVRSVRLPVKSG